jgi:hypothetical protein
MERRSTTMRGSAEAPHPLTARPRLMVLLYAVTVLFAIGVGIWGVMIPVGWGFAIVNALTVASDEVREVI